MILINTKNYKTGQALLTLAKQVEANDVHTILVVPASDIRMIAAKTVLNVYAQHVDYISNEKSTGKISASSLRAAGATGTLLNHSEHPITLDVLQKTIEQCKKSKLVTVVCVKSIDEAKKVAQFKPSAIAFEDPSLISSGKSITSYRSKDIEKFVSSLKGKPTIPICGAGITSVKDIELSYELGCKGVLISSAIASSKNPLPFLSDMAKFLKD